MAQTLPLRVVAVEAFGKDVLHGSLTPRRSHCDHRCRLGCYEMTRPFQCGRSPTYSSRKENTMYTVTKYESDLLFGALTGNGRVLVVDDEPSVRSVVRMTLEKA